MTIERLSDIIMAIYESALAPEGWHKALRAIADSTGSAGCRLIVQNDLGPVIYSVERNIERRTEGYRIEEMTAGLSGASTLVPIGEPIVLSRGGEATFSGSGEPWQELGGHAISDMLFVMMPTAGGSSVIFEAIKTEGAGQYGDDDLEQMRLICRHLSRAIRISGSLDLSRHTSEMFEASLEALSTGIYLIGSQERIVYLNRVARAQVRSGRVLRLVDGCLVATDQKAQKLLEAELRDIVGGDRQLDDHGGRAIALADGAGSGFVAHIIPLQGETQARIARHFAAIAAVFVQDPAAAPPLANAAFAKLYGLTEGELRLLNGLVPGLSLAETARQLGISEATAKTHLRRIFAKTKTAKQAELIYLLMTSTPPTAGP